MFNRSAVEVREDQAALRSAGYCASLSPFDQGKNNGVASFCANDAESCAGHARA